MNFDRLFGILRFNNPWDNSGGGNIGGNKKPENKTNNPWGEQPQKDDKKKEVPKKPNTDYNKVMDDFAKKFKDAWGNGGGNNKSGGGFLSSREQQNRFIALVVALVALLWLSSGFYKVGPNQKAIVLYFGKFNSVGEPGLNWHFPSPIGELIKENVTNVNIEEFGISSSKKDDDKDDVMLTGDENIVDIEYQVQWYIEDVEKYVFNIKDARVTVRKAAESAIREIIGKRPIEEALSDGKSKIEFEAKELLQNMLDIYGAGVTVSVFQLRRVDPPSQVIDAFRDLQTAKSDKEKAINEAESYSSDIIPKAKGEAAEMTQAALAYKERVIAEAQGQSARFRAVLKEYKMAPDLTKRRMYFETMEEVLKDMDKVILSGKTSGNAMPFLPINEMRNRKELPHSTPQINNSQVNIEKK